MKWVATKPQIFSGKRAFSLVEIDYVSLEWTCMSVQHWEMQCVLKNFEEKVSGVGTTSVVGDSKGVFFSPVLNPCLYMHCDRLQPGCFQWQVCCILYKFVQNFVFWCILCCTRYVIEHVATLLVGHLVVRAWNVLLIALALYFWSAQDVPMPLICSRANVITFFWEIRSCTSCQCKSPDWAA